MTATTTPTAARNLNTCCRKGPRFVLPALALTVALVAAAPARAQYVVRQRLTPQQQAVLIQQYRVLQAQQAARLQAAAQAAQLKARQAAAQKAQADKATAELLLALAVKQAAPKATTAPKPASAPQNGPLNPTLFQLLQAQPQQAGGSQSQPAWMADLQRQMPQLFQKGPGDAWLAQQQLQNPGLFQFGGYYGGNLFLEKMAGYMDHAAQNYQMTGNVMRGPLHSLLSFDP